MRNVASTGGSRARTVRAFGCALFAAVGFAACDPGPTNNEPCASWSHAPADATWDANADDGTPVPLRLNLPLPLGLTTEVSQGNGGAYSHTGDAFWAFDFAVPEGTQVLAAAGGVVVWVRDDSELWGASEKFRNEANYVLIDHGGGLFSAYVHLAKDSVVVVPGDKVAAGDLIAQTGLSGQMTGPHLHFHVENVWGRTLPIRFYGPASGTCDVLPALGDQLVADAMLPFATGGASRLPPRAFDEDGVTALRGLPGRLYTIGTRYKLTAKTTLEGATEVFVLFLPPAGGAALFAKKFAVVRGQVSGVVTLDEIPPGHYGLAVVAGTGGRVSVPRSILVTVIE